ncbi:hypothetical protein TWF225_006904 [Orbilia oligospora]|nr:hypothetical protein TWF225_006904 [Orbilia oligospora]KAF3264108.1 hypothetical protein TWF217_003265 [Orbilia oligospora]
MAVGFTISNTGSTSLQITKITYALTSQVNNTDIIYSNVVYNGDGTANAGSSFTLSALPTSGQSIAVGASLSVTANFKAVNGVESYNSILKIESNSSTHKILLTGRATTAPKTRWLTSGIVLLDYLSHLSGQCIFDSCLGWNGNLVLALH